MTALLFWGSFFLLVYIYFGYLFVTMARAAIRPKPRQVAPIEPLVSVIVVAHNEQDRVDARIENLLALDYPPDRLDVIVGSDGSTDETVDRVRRYEARGVRVQAFLQRRDRRPLQRHPCPPKLQQRRGLPHRKSSPTASIGSLVAMCRWLSNSRTTW